MALTPAPVEEISCDAFAPPVPRDRPLVVRGLCRNWPAVQYALQSDEAVLGYFGTIDSRKPIKTILGEPEINGAFSYGENTRTFNFQQGAVAFHLVAARLLEQKLSPAPKSIYIQSSSIPEHFPGFLNEHKMAVVPEWVPPHVWMGNRTITQTHYDLYDNLAVVVAGRRRFTLFPPDQLVNLYPGPFERTPGGTPVSMVDIAAPDLSLYPRFAEAAKTALGAELSPGDALYMPYGWWHHVMALEAVNVLVNYWWNSADVPDVNLYNTMVYALMSFRDLEPRKRDVWKTIFDYYVFASHGHPLGHLPPDEQGAFGEITAEEVQQTKRHILDVWKSEL